MIWESRVEGMVGGMGGEVRVCVGGSSVIAYQVY